jgi:hypothetical protein
MAKAGTKRYDTGRSLETIRIEVIDYAGTI